ncbi:unnamed protein product [Rotaria sp. Silwood1]|nr:unnamed protein product [Rotaria sp. Silwood1]CAF3436935.1 unnamed protein product [Rotaria sp. Silwood1]CAF3437791.1 unnamed protein product [Rotaria sp. Silwood1]
MGQCTPKCIKPSISSNSINNAKQTTISSESLVITPTSNNNNSTRSSRIRIVQNFVLLWLDSNINESNEDFKHSLTQLRRIVNTINTFIDSDQCINFLTQIKDEKVFMIVSGSFSQTIVPQIHDLSQLDSIYVFCENKSKYEQLTKEWTKIKGIFTQIELICITLKQDTQQCDRDSVAISVTTKNLDRLEPSFMYTQLLKKLLLEMEYDNKVKKELCEFCRKQYSHNFYELQIIDDFEQNYNDHTPIWWYTRECFTYQMLNRALRIQDVEVIIKMGFFLRDVHQHIGQLHSQMKDQGLFTVYRGKSMPNDDFNEIKQKEGGLLAFNTFLSTSLNETVSLQFAQKSLHKPGLVGVLFQITVDPSIQSIPFASIASVSAIQNEEEILFSMHTIFRISQIKQIADRVWRVELTFTNDDDQELKRLTEHMRQETLGTTKLDRLGQLLIKMGNFDSAEEVYKILSYETPKDNETVRASRFYYLGEIKCHKGNYTEALEFYQKSLEIREKCLPSNHPDLAATYNGIGLIHDNMGEYAKALEFYQKSLDIQQTSISSNQPKLAETYNNIGAVYLHLGDIWKALEFYQNSLEISPTYLPPNHPDMASIYNNIAQVYHRIQEYPKALEFYQKSLEIRQKSLPENHPDLAILYTNIGS